MTHLYRRFVLSLFFFVSLSFGVSAQKTMSYQEPLSTYQRALDLYAKEKYSAAQHLFQQVILELNNPSNIYSEEAEFYIVQCAIKLYHQDGSSLAVAFLDRNTEQIRKQEVYVELANYNYNSQQFSQAIKYLELITVDKLTQEQQYDYYFKLGYSYFRIKKLNEAQKTFALIKGKDHKYKVPTSYFYGHCAYINKNFQTALESFKEIINDENFGQIIPYYIVQIYYNQKKYEDMLRIAVPLFKNVTATRAPEISHMIAEASYRTGKFDQAIDYFKLFQNASPNLSKEDAYMLGFSYYRKKDYENAAFYLQTATTAYDSLAQNAHYHLADCYIKTNQKQFALNAFLLAHMPYDKEIQEDALFNYAKLSYELQNNVYNEAINAFQKYINYYPTSPKVDMANAYLVDLFMNTRNYKDALMAINKIEKKTYKLAVAYQKITYYRAVELFNDNQLDDAVKLFDISLQHKHNERLNAMAMYWKGEIAYRKKEYKKAIDQFSAFQLTSGAYSVPQYNTANYNIGYAFFKLKDYDNAIISFKKYTSTVSFSDTSRVYLNDAHLRTADSYFIKKEYANSIESFDKAIALNVFDIDYAIYQKALAYGLLQKYEEKVSALIELLKRFSSSPYADDATFELANICLTLQQYDKAYTYYNKLVDEFPNSTYVQKSQLQIGLLQFNTNRNEEALVTFKKIVELYPSTSTSKEALVSIRNIYMEMDKIQDFFAYVKSLSFADVSDAEQDSLTYMTVENHYMQGNCEKSLLGFAQYLDKFPRGAFVVNANYYMAECELKMGNKEKAIAGYVFVLTKPNTKFSESSALHAATLLYSLNDYGQALTYFEQLAKLAEFKKNIEIAQIGMMKCHFFLSHYDKAIQSAKLVLANEKASPDVQQEAFLTVAKSSMATEDFLLAYDYFSKAHLILNNESGAEAKYMMAYIRHLENKYAECEDITFELINHVPSYDYWIGKAFILLAENYVKLNNVFQAKHTLQSIIDMHDNPEIVKLAQAKLTLIQEEEKQAELKRLEAERLRLAETERQNAIREQNEEAKRLQGVNAENTGFIIHSNLLPEKMDSTALPVDNSQLILPTDIKLEEDTLKN